MRWETEAIEYIEEIVGSAPVHSLYTRFSKQATKQGWHPRTYHAFKRKIERLGLDQRAIDDHWNLCGLARALEITQYRVRYWVSKGLKTSRKEGKHPEIRSQDVRFFARKYPDLFRGIERSNLLFVLEDADLCDHIISLGQPSQGYSARIIRTDTLETYPSMRSAAKTLRIPHRSVWESIHYGRPTHGIQFKKLETRKPKNINAS